MAGGVRIAMFVTTMTLAMSTLGAMGYYDDIGVGYDTGLQTGIENQADNAQEPEVFGTGAGNLGPSIFGITIGIVRTAQNFLGLVLGDVFRILASWGAPLPIASAVQIVVDYSVAVTIWIIARGFDFLR